LTNPPSFLTLRDPEKNRALCLSYASRIQLSRARNPKRLNVSPAAEHVQQQRPEKPGIIDTETLTKPSSFAGWKRLANVTDKRPKFDTEHVVAYWLTEAEEAYHVAEHLVEKGDRSYALFFGHLAVEKTLKAIYVHHRQEHAPLIHNLLRLARLSGLEPTKAQTEDLLTITAFNIEARYPDLKRTFRAKCTPAFTGQQMARIQEVLQWLNTQIV
jgi:HEPN domain-containing protein